ncbi:nicotinate-nucleotide--dimethylbenzimidazole phosphoribosyltransferase [Streptomyces sp. NPDC006997]|uniref:nicotinate-nucleotide--dimethylbenzimidazole phosphoribosyltransferase n=1 Tax=Streptomyces sp. NPDC006997 TaxID=3155356 RepID=UPI003400BE7E
MPSTGSEPTRRPAVGLRLERTLPAITPADPGALAAARDRQNRLTKPPGSLGLLEDVSIQLAGLAGSCPPPMPTPAARRVPVILDGVIASSAALVAAALSPDALAACVAGHRSVEPGHTVALHHLGLRPLVDLGLRLGEGTGALLALPLVQAGVRALREMATFDSAGVANKQG